MQNMDLSKGDTVTHEV
jgi:hypothetical protein